MKKILLIPLIFCVVFVTGCANNRRINDKVIEPYGFMNMDDKHEDIKYRISKGNVVWSIILCETIVAPVVLCGWYLWEPVEKIEAVK